MGAISTVSAGVFDPNDVEAMSTAYEEVCNALHINGDAGARETIAVRVIELARRGDVAPRSCATGCLRTLTPAAAKPSRFVHSIERRGAMPASHRLRDLKPSPAVDALTGIWASPLLS